MNYPCFSPRLLCVRSLLVFACFPAAVALRGDDRVTVRGKASPEYTAWKFGSGEIKNESYVFNQGRFFGGTTRDPVLEKMPFIDLAKSLANDLVGQHYYPAESLHHADLLIIVEWGVTTVADSTYKQFARDNPTGMADIDAGRRDAMHAMAEAERANDTPSASVQMMDQGYEMNRLNGLISDAEFQELDQKALNMGLASNAALVGFDDELRADANSAFGTFQGQMLRAFMADERYFVALNAYDCREFIQHGKFELVWSLRLSMRAPGMNFRQGVGLMSNAGRAAFGHKTDGVEIKIPHEKSPHVEVGTPVVLPMAAERGAK
ncbi:MAG TPA: hypothetical protein VG838_09470 [Opitutaceae bacterium]|nr:hypothetical protein [Opitutaceae bacterium]